MLLICTMGAFILTCAYAGCLLVVLSSHENVPPIDSIVLLYRAVVDGKIIPAAHSGSMITNALQVKRDYFDIPSKHLMITICKKSFFPLRAQIHSCCVQLEIKSSTMMLTLTHF